MSLTRCLCENHMWFLSHLAGWLAGCMETPFNWPLCIRVIPDMTSEQIWGRVVPDLMGFYMFIIHALGKELGDRLKQSLV